MADSAKTPRSRSQHARPQVCALVSRASDPITMLTTRIERLGWETVLEDQAATLATYEWQLRTGGRVSEETSARYRQQVERFIEGLGLWPLADGQKHPVTLWHLATPGLGIPIVYNWRKGLDDPEEVVTCVFGDGYRALERFFRTFLCIPGAIADYGSLGLLNQGVARQAGSVVLTERYGPLANPCPKAWQPGKKQRPQEPVPSYAEWLEVLDALWARQAEWVRTLPPRKWFPLVRTVAMLHLQSASGCRPSETRLVKQGDLFADRLRILHGGQKDRFPKNKDSDHYGNLRGRYRQVSLLHVPAGLSERLMVWRELLGESRRVPIRPEGALFPNDFGTKENCVSYERYRDGLKQILLEVSDLPGIRDILGPYLVKASPDQKDWDLTLKPHTVRAIYVTFRMARCSSMPGAFRLVMEELGWREPSTVLRYDRPGPLDSQDVRNQMFEDFRQEELQ